MANNTNATAVQKRPENEIKKLLSDPKSVWFTNIAKLLPSRDKVERFMGACLSQVAVPKNGYRLLQCSKESWYSAISASARWDVLPDGINGYLIPYGNSLTFQISARGLVDFLKRNKVVKDVGAWIVYENDEFQMDMGKVIKHTFDFRDSERESSRVCGVWCRAVLPDSSTKDMWMGVSDIEKIRTTAKSKDVWEKWYDQMAIKSVIKRLCKTLENTPELNSLLKDDDESSHGGVASTYHQPNKVTADELLSEDNKQEAVDVESEVVEQ